MSIGERIPLTFLVAVCATLELVLNRIGVHLLSSADVREDPLFWLVDRSGLFFFYLTGLLALVTFTWATVVLIRDRHLVRLVDRIAFIFLSALFLPLCTMGLVFSLPHAVAPHLNTSFGLLLVAMVVSFLFQPAPLRAKLGVVYLAAPLLLHGYWLMTQQIPSLGPRGEVPSQLFTAAEHLVVVGAFAAFLFFTPFPRLASLLQPGPVVVAVLLTGGGALLMRYQYVETAQAVYHGLGINLPPPSMQSLIHLGALFVFTLTLGTLTMRGARERGVALGLYLVAVSGFHLQLPYQFLLTLLGMMQVGRASLDPERLPARGEHRRHASFPAAEAWRAYLERLATICAQPAGTGEVVVLQNGGQQVAHIRGQREGLPFTLRVLQADARLQRVEVTVGQPPKDPAPISVTRRHEGVSVRSSGPRVKIDLPLFDERFALHDGTGRAAEILGEAALMERVQRLLRGSIGLWPGEGVHCVCAPGPDGWPFPLAEIAFSAEDAATDDVTDLLALTVALASRVGVRG